MLRLIPLTALALLASLVFVNSASAGYDPEVCKRKLTEMGFTVCPIRSGNCHEVIDNPAIHNFCSRRGIYAPFSMNMLENPKTREKKMFSNMEEMFHFLREHPDYQPRQCYCCC